MNEDYANKRYAAQRIAELEAEVTRLKNKLASGSATSTEVLPTQLREATIFHGDAAQFLVFDLKDGGRVSIPPDQVRRMWNAEQRSAASPDAVETATPRGDHAETIRTALEYSKRMRGSAADDAALSALAALQEERERMRADSRRLDWFDSLSCAVTITRDQPKSDSRPTLRQWIDAAIGAAAPQDAAALQRCLDHDKYCAEVGAPVPIAEDTGTADDQIDPAVVEEIRRRIERSGVTTEQYIAAFDALTPEQIREMRAAITQDAAPPGREIVMSDGSHCHYCRKANCVCAETQSHSAANSAKGEAAMLRGNACACGEITDAHLCLVRRGGANMDDLKQKCWCDCHTQQLAADHTVDANEKVKASATVSEGACECPARKALEKMVQARASAEHDPNIPNAVRDWIAAANCAARVALSAPRPCDGLRREIAEIAPRLKTAADGVEALGRERDSLRTELAGARDALLGEGYPITGVVGEVAAGIKSTGAGWRLAELRETERIRQLAASQEREREVAAQLEFDRTALADAITGIKKAFDSRFWLTEGRGSYEWDDDRYREEFREAYQEISRAIEPLKKIAADWTACPRKAEDVAQARIDLKQRAEAAEERERVLREALVKIRDWTSTFPGGPHASVVQMYAADVLAATPEGTVRP